METLNFFPSSVHVLTYTTALTTDDRKTVFEEFFDVKEKWMTIGLLLGLNYSDLRDIESQYTNNNRCLNDMVILWLKRRPLLPTWQSLINALRSRTIQEEALADDIEMKYIRSEEEGNDDVLPEDQLCS